MRIAEPSIIATSSTWPVPDRCASRIPHTTPNAMNMPPPPKSPTRLRGGTGLRPSLSLIWQVLNAHVQNRQNKKPTVA